MAQTAAKIAYSNAHKTSKIGSKSIQKQLFNMNSQQPKLEAITPTSGKNTIARTKITGGATTAKIRVRITLIGLGMLTQYRDV